MIFWLIFVARCSDVFILRMWILTLDILFCDAGI